MSSALKQRRSGRKPFASSKSEGKRFGLRWAPSEQPSPRILVSPRWRWAPVIGLLLALPILPRLLWRGWRERLYWLGVGLVAALLLAVRGVFEARIPRLRRIVLPVQNLPPAFDGLRIGHLSDLHVDRYVAAEVVAAAIDRLLAEAPDLIVVTGDFVTDSIPPELLHRLLDRLVAPHGIFGIWGNHDYWVPIDELRAVIDATPVTLLENAHVVLRRGADRLYLAGTDDQWEGSTDLDRALRGIPADQGVILLAHEPDLATEAVRHGVLLQLSGHAHGGHIGAPWLGALFLPRYARSYSTGLYNVAGTWLYVSNGLGGYPFRLGARTEATIIELRRCEIAGQ